MTEEGDKATDGRLPVVVLAGGLGRRMGGADKALIRLGQATLLDHVLARLAGQASRIAISANGDAARFARFGLGVLPDPVAGRPGPLAGILAGMLWATELGLGADLVTVPVDCPFLPRDLVARLRAARLAEGAELATASSAGRLHPVVGLWPAALAETLRQVLQDGSERRVGAFTSRYRLATATFETDGIDPFFNVNCPEDRAAAQACLA